MEKPTVTNIKKKLFLKNIEHPDYQVTKKLIKNVRDSGLQDYVTAIRKQERKLLTENFKIKKQKLAHLRRKNNFLWTMRKKIMYKKSDQVVLVFTLKYYIMLFGI